MSDRAAHSMVTGAKDRADAIQKLRDGAKTCVIKDIDCSICFLLAELDAADMRIAELEAKVRKYYPYYHAYYK